MIHFNFFLLQVILLWLSCLWLKSIRNIFTLPDCPVYRKFRSPQVPPRWVLAVYQQKKKCLPPFCNTPNWKQCMLWTVRRMLRIVSFGQVHRRPASVRAIKALHLFQSKPANWLGSQATQMQIAPWAVHTDLLISDLTFNGLREL